MRTWALIADTWREAWARRSAVVLSAAAVLLLVLYGAGLHAAPDPNDPQRVRLTVFGSAPDTAGSPMPALPRADVAAWSAMGALLLLNPWGILFGLFLSVSLLTGALQPGRLAWVLSKPVSRIGLLGGRALGASSLTVCAMLAFAGGMTGLIAWKTGVVPSGLLAGAGLLALNYVVLVAGALLVAVWTRSTAVSLIGAVVLYGGTLAVDWLHSPEAFGFLPGVWRVPVEAAYLVLPKLVEVETLAVRLVTAQPLPPVAPPLVSTAAFGLVAFGLAVWVFQRRDV